MGFKLGKNGKTKFMSIIRVDAEWSWDLNKERRSEPKPSVFFSFSDALYFFGTLLCKKSNMLLLNMSNFTFWFGDSRRRSEPKPCVPFVKS